MQRNTHPGGLLEERRVGRAGLAALLKALSTRNMPGAKTLYISPGAIEECLAGIQAGNGLGPDELTRLAARIKKSETGAVVFWSQEEKLVVFPPFPLERQQSREGWDVSQLMSLLTRKYTLGVVLLRLGRFAVGVFRGDVLVSSKTDTRYVKSRHSAGGQSQMRFQRIREKQVQEIFKKTCSVVQEHFSPFEDQLDYIFLGGERFTIQGFLKQCDYLQTFSPKILGRMLNVREPKHKALEGVIDTIWESQVLCVP